jgi:methylated-DNA-[protein]-cysteine S-methyltransferase
MVNLFYAIFPSSFDTFTIIWKEVANKLLIERIFLSDTKSKSEIKARNNFLSIKEGSSTEIDSISEKIKEFLNGYAQNFDQSLLDYSVCYPIQRKVLEAESKIPRSWVSTYKRIAIHIDHPKSARIVGNALAKNPFPIFIPCHRAIKSNGEIGGFQGGNEMKRRLLEYEGVKISNNGKVILDKVYY